MEALRQQLAQLRQEIESFPVTDAADAESFRIRFLGTKGALKSVMGEMKQVAPEQRKEAGQLLNEFKSFAEGMYEQHLDRTATHPSNGSSRIDRSLPGSPEPIGSRHPVTRMKNEIVAIFQKLGFAVAEGPEIRRRLAQLRSAESTRTPSGTRHAGYILRTATSGLGLRTHTSSVQIREMEKGILPIRMLMPGRVFRNETISARSHCFFHQVEGLYIDEQVSFADLKQTLYFFVQEMYGKDVKVRFRPSYFPFTEPSAEMDITCFICAGDGCPVCKKSGWVEILGCGMVHPNVLRNCNIDPEKYTGFAFGMGVERPAMLKYGVSDLRLFSENDVRFLRQFPALT